MGILFAFSSLLFIALLIILVTVAISKGKLHYNFESPEKRAGRYGERFATQIIGEILKDDDTLLTNLHIVAAGKQCELDNVVINNRGVFIIEVKNYTGELYGEEDDEQWIKNKITPGGSFYQETIRNPIKQVDRQIYITAQYLKEYGLDTWVEGYVFFVERNSPVVSKRVLVTQKDIDNAIHNGRSNKLTAEMKDRIVELLKGS